MSSMTRVRGLLDTQFDECSTLAGATRSRSIDLIENGTQVSEQFLVSDFGDVSRVVLESLDIVPFVAGISVSDEEKNHYYANFALMRDVNALSGRYSPKLLAIFEDDISLPVASFDLRPHQACSHAQIGSEMHPDNIYVTPKDKRKIELEGIKTILDGGYVHDESRTRLQAVIEAEMKRCAIEFDSALDKSFLRYMGGVLGRYALPQSKEFMVVNGKETGTRQEVFQYNSVGYYGDKNTPRIIIAQRERDLNLRERFSDRRKRAMQLCGELSVLAVTRENVAIELFGVGREGSLVGFEESRRVRMRAVREYFNRVDSAQRQVQDAKVKYEYLKSKQKADFTQEKEYHDAVNNARCIGNNLSNTFQIRERFDEVLGKDRYAVDSILQEMHNRAQMGVSDIRAVIPPGTEFSGPYDSTLVTIQFTKRAFNSVGVVCHVRPLSTNLEPVEAYDETIFLDKPNDNPKSLQNYHELARLISCMNVSKITSSFL